MEINRKFFPEIMNDNDEMYFMRLVGIIESVDELSSLQITKLSDSYHFRLASSHPKYNDLLLRELLRFHTLYGIHLDLSKSIKTTGTIAFQIKL